MKKVLTSLFFAFTIITASSQISYQIGAVRGNTNDNTSITRMEFDNYNYHVMFGKFHDSVHVDALSGGNTLLGGSTAVHNAFFSVYDDFGYNVYAHKFGTVVDSVTINCALIDNSGNVYIGGSFSGTIDFADNGGSPFYLTATGGDPDGFIASFDYMGNFMNAIAIECDSTMASVNSLAFNANNEIIAVGNFIGMADIDGSLATLNYFSTGIDGFLATYDWTLNLLSAIQFDGVGNQIPTHVKTDWNDILIGGNFTTQFDFDLTGGSNILPSNGAKDFFMLYLDPNYTVYNYLNVGGPGNDVIKDFYFNFYQGFFVLADFQQTVNFDPNVGTTNLTSNGQSDVAILRYHTNFDLGYAKQIGNSNNDIGYRIIQNSDAGSMRGGPPPSAPSDDYIVIMSFNGTIDVNPEPTETLLVSSTNTPRNSAIINIDSSGYLLFHGVIEAESIVGYKGAGMNGNNMILAGNFVGTNVDMLPYAETSTLSHSGAKSGFYMHYDRCQLVIGDPYIVQPFECGTATVPLGIEVLSGGVEPFYFNWSNGDYYSYEQYPTDAYQDNSWYYNINVTDYYGCNYGDTLWVRSSDPEISATLTITNTSCGNNLGSALAVPVNSLGTTSYYWSNGDTDDTADSLLAGNYFVHVIDDSLKCYASMNFFIDNSDGPQITVNSSVDANCGNVNTGMIDVSVTGGSTPYTYHWTNGATTEDISNLSGGTYTLTVTDASGCENSICITLTQPEGIQSYYNYYSSSCLSANGTIMVEAYGGSGPLTYQWDVAAGSSTNDTVYNLPAGFYTVTITDSLGCSEDFSYGISDWNGPYGYISWVSSPDCLGNTGYIDAYSWDSNFSGILFYDWSTGETTEDIFVSDGGWYDLTITDGIGCITTTSAYVWESLPMAPTICMVTVDSTATQNVVVWDKSTTQEANYYNIYREGFCNSNDFGIVGSVDFDSLSVFYDTVVNSDTRTWRYYVTAVDTCGNESDPSEIHRTIHLTTVVDADTNVFLDWSDYQGMQILGYKIYRRQAIGPLFDYVDSVDAFQTNYLDTIDFTGYTEAVYFIDAVPASVCNATRAYNQNEARSNHSRAGLPQPDTSTISLPELNTEDLFALYPNPGNDMVNLVVKGSKQIWTMEMTDQTGRIVMNGTVRDRVTLSIKEIPAGVYFIRMTSDKNEFHTLKLMVIH